MRGGGGRRGRRAGAAASVADLEAGGLGAGISEQRMQKQGRGDSQRGGCPAGLGAPGRGGASKDQRLPGLVPRWQGSRRSPASTPLPRLTVRRVRPEGDLDLKLPVGVLDGGQWQEGVGGLREVGYHALCGQKAQVETTLPQAAGRVRPLPWRGGGGGGWAHLAPATGRRP